MCQIKQNQFQTQCFAKQFHVLELNQGQLNEYLKKDYFCKLCNLKKRFETEGMAPNARNFQETKQLP